MPGTDEMDLSLWVLESPFLKGNKGDGFFLIIDTLVIFDLQRIFFFRVKRHRRLTSDRCVKKCGISRVSNPRGSKCETFNLNGKIQGKVEGVELRQRPTKRMADL